jgi:ABC-type Fe2+-enterobactin transport system substrate-binding protein
VVHATRHRSAGRWFRPASGDQRPARSRSDVASVGESLLASTAPAGASAAATRVARAP